MANFIYVFRGGAFAHKDLSPSEVGAHLQKWSAWLGELAKSGHQPAGSGLQAMGKTVRGKSKTVTDGPYAEAKDLVTGNLAITAESIDEATELATACPIFEFDGSVEVRPVYERGDM